jgi:hypothetical protein
VHRVRELVELGLEVAALVAGDDEVLLPPRLGALRGRTLLVRPGERDLDVREQLPRAGADGPGDGGLVPQPCPALLGTRACLAFGARGPVQRIGPPGKPLDPFLVRTRLKPGLHLGLPSVGPVGREPVPYGGVGLLLERHLLGDGEPFGQFLRLLDGPFEGFLRSGGRRGAPLGLSRGAPRLPGQPPELLGDLGLLPLTGPPPLAQLLDESGPFPAQLSGPVLFLGQLLAQHAQFFQLGRRLVDGGLYFEQTRRPGGTALGEVRPEQVALRGHRGQLGPGVDEILGVLQRPDHDDAPQQPTYGRHEVGGPTDQIGGEQRTTALRMSHGGCHADARAGRPGLPGLPTGCVAGVAERSPGRESFRRPREQQRRPSPVLLAQQADGVRRR